MSENAKPKSLTADVETLFDLIKEGASYLLHLWVKFLLNCSQKEILVEIFQISLFYVKILSVRVHREFVRLSQKKLYVWLFQRGKNVFVPFVQLYFRDWKTNSCYVSIKKPNQYNFCPWIWGKDFEFTFLRYMIPFLDEYYVTGPSSISTAIFQFHS